MSRCLYYLATPYTNFQQGRTQAFVEACAAAAALMKRGMIVFSPIAHSHPIAVHGDISQIDHDFWLGQDILMLDKSDVLLVAMMPGWRQSKGICAEIAHAEKTGKPVCYLSWPMLEGGEKSASG